MAQPARRLSPEQSKARWRFARLGALGAVMAALLLEAIFALSGAGQYFHRNAASVILFHHAAEKATRESLGTGDIQLTLDWKGSADLDLHCQDAAGQSINFGQRRSPSGGRLDFDMNAGSPPWSNDSVENIFWPFGTAPEGQYIVSVHAYRRHGGPERVPFRLRVLHRGQVNWVQGVAVFQAPLATNLSDPVNSLPPQEFFRFRIDTPPSILFGQRLVDWVGVGTVAAWLALVSLSISLAILGGLNSWYEANRGGPLARGQRAQVLAGRSLGWGALHGALAQVGFAILGGAAVLVLEAWRLAAWVVLSSWAGGRTGRIMPAHLLPRDGAQGGRWGGLSAGLAFFTIVAKLPPSVLKEADIPARLLAALLIGACIGWQVILPAPASQAQAPVEEPPGEPLDAPEPEPEPEPELVPANVMRVTSSHGGRGLGGRDLGGARQLGGGRTMRVGRGDEE